MAATETATAAGTRRAVIRSERFVQWQRDLSSARRAPYGSRKRNDDGLINHIQAHQNESENGNETKVLQGTEKEACVENVLHINLLKGNVQVQQQIEGLNSKKTEVEASLEHKRDGLHISSEPGLCNGPQFQPAMQQVCQHWQGKETQQVEPASALPVKRRRRCARKDQESQQSRRSSGSNGIAKLNLPRSKTSKRSTRLLAKTLHSEEPPPPPLKLPKLHVVLSRKEVQEDWLQMTGHRYRGKPRKSALIHLGLGLCTSLTCPSTVRYLTHP